jgi:hypothetical protein
MALMRAMRAIGIVILNKNIPIIHAIIDCPPNSRHGNESSNEITQTFFRPNLSAKTHHRAFPSTMQRVNIITNVQTFHG